MEVTVPTFNSVYLLYYHFQFCFLDWNNGTSEVLYFTENNIRLSQYKN